MGDLLELIPATERFELFSTVKTDFIKAFEDPKTKRKMFRGIASSTTKDLHGDTITLSALREMEQQAVGLTMFLNHSYDVPDDVGGTITKAIVKQKGVDDKGDPLYILEIEGEVEEDNPAALKTWIYVQKGRKLGLSIGAMIPDGGAQRQKNGSYIINSVQLLEVSFVGIPANPKSWIEYAASALRGIVEKSQTHQLSNPTLTLKDGRYLIEGSIEGLELNLGVDTKEPEHRFSLDAAGRVEITRSIIDKDGGSVTEMLGAWDLSDTEDALVAAATVGEDVIAKATVWVTTRDGDQITIGEPADDPGVTASVDPNIIDAKGKNTTPCPECGKTDCESDGDLHGAAPDPDITDAKIRVIEIDTDDDQSSVDGQGASSSEPADETYSAPEADVTAAADEPEILDGATLDQLMQLSFDQLRSIAKRAVDELVTAKRALAEEREARKAAEDAVRVVMELVVKTNQIIEKVANSPLPRKAVIKDAQQQFSASVEAVYGKDIADALKRRA